MSNRCKWLHHQLEGLPLLRFPFSLEQLPDNGIYFFYEDGEIWGHGGDKPRIVRIGTHRDGNFRSRIKEHFLFDDSRMDFGSDDPKPSDRSIFRKNIGRALLNERQDNYLGVWEIDFMRRNNREQYEHLRDIQKENEIESKVTRILRQNFSFRFIIVENQTQRIGPEGLEGALIGTTARCELCKPSRNWLGKHSPKHQIRESGLWLVQHLGAPELDEQNEEAVLDAVARTGQTRQGW